MHKRKHISHILKFEVQNYTTYRVIHVSVFMYMYAGAHIMVSVKRSVGNCWCQSFTFNLEIGPFVCYYLIRLASPHF